MWGSPSLTRTAATPGARGLGTGATRTRRAWRGAAMVTRTVGHSWSERFGGGSYQDAQGVAVDSLDRVLVTGSFQGNVNFGGGALTANGTDAHVARAASGGGARAGR